jgi:hypothetical protein
LNLSLQLEVRTKYFFLMRSLVVDTQNYSKNKKNCSYVRIWSYLFVVSVRWAHVSWELPWTHKVVRYEKTKLKCCHFVLLVCPSVPLPKRKQAMKFVCFCSFWLVFQIEILKNWYFDSAKVQTYKIRLGVRKYFSDTKTDWDFKL